MSCALLLTLCLAAAASGHAHPSHLSFAEMEYNRRNGHLEVALQMIPEDLEQALRWRTNRRIDLERSPEVDAALSAYLAEHFVLRGPDGERRALLWVGKEVTIKEAWLYFEFDLGSSFEGSVIEHRVLFELQDDQVNAGQFRCTGPSDHEAKKRSLRFSAQEPAWELRADGPRPVDAPAALVPAAVFVEPRLRERLERILSVLVGTVFLDVPTDEEQRPEGWRRGLLDHLQRGDEALHPANLRVQLAISQLIGGHLDTARGHLRSGADREGVVATLARLRAQLERAAEHAEQQELPTLARRLRSASRQAQLEL